MPNEDAVDAMQARLLQSMEDFDALKKSEMLALTKETSQALSVINNNGGTVAAIFIEKVEADPAAAIRTVAKVLVGLISFANEVKEHKMTKNKKAGASPRMSKRLLEKLAEAGRQSKNKISWDPANLLQHVNQTLVDVTWTEKNQQQRDHLLRIRKALDAGDAVSAMKVLDEMLEEFPKTSLSYKWAHNAAVITGIIAQ